jgi:hypothetical protein
LCSALCGDCRADVYDTGRVGGELYVDRALRNAHQVSDAREPQDIPIRYARNTNMRIRPIPVATIAALLTIAACSGSRHYNWTNHSSTAGMTVLVVADDDELQAEVVDNDHRLTWTFNDQFPAGTKEGGFLVVIGDEKTISVVFDDDETMSSLAPVNRGSQGPWVRLSRAIGTLTVWHANESVTPSSGRIDLELEPSAIAAIRSAGWAPTGRDALRLMLTNATADELLSYRRVDADLSLGLAWELTRHNTNANQYGAFVDLTEFDDLEVTKLLHHGVSLITTVKWYELGNQASVDELIYCQQRDIGPDLAIAWRNVDAPLSFEQMYWTKQRGVRPELHRAWVEADHELNLEALYWVLQRNLTPNQFREWADVGKLLNLEQLYWSRQRNLKASSWEQWRAVGKTLTLEQLYWAQTRGLKAMTSRAWSDIGQDLSLEELVQAQSYGIKASVAGEWRSLGYTPTIAQLSDLRSYGVSPDFAQRFLSPKFELPTFKELKHYRSYGKKPANVNKLRKPARDSGSH